MQSNIRRSNARAKNHLKVFKQAYDSGRYGTIAIMCETTVDAAFIALGSPRLDNSGAATKLPKGPMHALG